MIKNIGVDQIEVDRIAKVVDRGDGFARKGSDRPGICPVPGLDS